MYRSVSKAAKRRFFQAATRVVRWVQVLPVTGLVVSSLASSLLRRSRR